MREADWPLWLQGIGSRLPQGIFLPLAGFALHVLASILLINLNNVFTIIRIRTSLQSFFYLLLAAALPSLYGVIPGLLAGLCFLTAIYLLFGSYRQEKSSGALFNSFAFAGIASLFVPQSLLLIPLLWIGASSFQSLNLKSLFASLLGFALPWWMLLSYAVLTETTQEFFSQLFDETVLFRPLGYGFDPWMVLPLGLLFLLFAASTLHCFLSEYEDKIRTRMIYEIFSITGIYVMALLAVQPNLYSELTGIMVVNTAPLIAHYIVFTNTRLTNVSFFVIVLSILLMTIYGIWMPS